MKREKILWVSFRQKHLSSYEQHFSSKDIFNHQLIEVKLRNRFYLIGYVVAFIKLVFGFYNKEYLNQVLSKMNEVTSKSDLAEQGNLMKKVKALFWLNWAQEKLQGKEIKALVLWGGIQVYQVALEIIAVQRGIRVIFMENGILPNTTQVEEFGVNWRSKLRFLNSEEYMNLPIDPAKKAAIFSLPIIPRELREVSKEKEQEWGQESPATLPDRFIFLPFQVSKDSQIQLYSPWIPDMPALVESVYQGVGGYNRSNADSLVIVAKEHPSDFGRADYSEMKKGWQKKGIVFANSIVTAELIEKSQGVITINSSVGAEALLRKKPVIVLGQAVYSQSGVTQQANSIPEITRALENMNQAYDIDKLEHFVYYLYEKRLVKGHWRRQNKLHWQELECRLQEILTEAST